ncbi:MAG: amidophosphoribosyltransferase [Firmicutes bacterium]|nr:amidophosphoribosyltransferase [Bacillota bacterium]
MSVKEECGIFGVYSPQKKDIAKEIYFGLFALQHRGQQSAGIAVQDGTSAVSYYKEMGLVNNIFAEDGLKKFPRSNAGIGHVRYSPETTSHVINAQPVVFYGRRGRMAVAYNGSLLNAQEIKEQMLSAGQIFQSSVNSEVLAALINFHSKNSIEEGIIKACKQLKGAFSLVVLAENKLYCARDSMGIKPLAIGKREDDILIASESCALDAVDAELLRDVTPGEIIMIDGGEIKSTMYNGSKRKLCIFEYVYLARNDSTIDGVSVYNTRYTSGKILANLYKIDADVVAGVPDSALAAARGYSDTSKIPFVDALIKNRYIGRTFIEPTQALRETSVKVKLSAFKSNVEGKRIILIDDSIVRGTTSRKIIKLLRRNGAKEVHMLIASPMVKHACYFGVDLEASDQMIACFNDKDEICKIIGADSLNYLPLPELRKACLGKSTDFCAGCFEGKYPCEVTKVAPKVGKE